MRKMLAATKNVTLPRARDARARDACQASAKLQQLLGIGPEYLAKLFAAFGTPFRHCVVRSQLPRKCSRRGRDSVPYTRAVADDVIFKRS